jgi:hypothetical protein
MAEATIYVVTSSEARSGKSFFARLLVDFLLLAKRDPMVFDAGWPHQHMRARWPGRTYPADFSKVQGQMAFFDRVLAVPAMPARDGVLDLSSRDLQVFMSLAEDIQFSREMALKGLGLELFFILADTLESRRLIDRIKAMKLFRAVHYLRPAMVPTSHFGTLPVSEIVIPQLSPSIVEHVERVAFSVEAFLRGRRQGLNDMEAKEFDAFLDKVMGGIDAIVTVEKERR